MATATTGHKRVDIRCNDTVKVITGRDKGKEGRVLRVFPDDGKVLVEHVMLVKKHVRPNPQRNVKGGIADQYGLAAKNVATEKSGCARNVEPRWISKLKSGCRSKRQNAEPSFQILD